MKLYLKIISFLVVIITVFAIFTPASLAMDFDVSAQISDLDKAKNICLYSMEADKAVFSKNVNDKIFPGSAVKMMTGLIACEMLSDRLDEVVIITDEMLKEASGFNVKLQSGMTVTVENLLYGALCGGGNDAALVLAKLCGGSVDGFVALMNDKAIELGAKNTFFTNPTGLDDSKMFSTLSDIIIVAKKASQNQLYLDISSTPSYSYTPVGDVEDIKMFNRNALISTFYAVGYKNPNVMGLISGNTDLGGYCTITYSQKNGQSYICAVMGATADDYAIYSYELINSLLSYAFNNISYQKIATKGQRICYANVRFVSPEGDFETQRISCVVSDDVYSLMYSGVDVQTDLAYRYYFHNEVLDAPFDEGVIVGGVDIMYNGKIIGSSILVTGESIEAKPMLLLLNNLKLFFSGRIFWLSVAFFVLIFLLYYHFAEIRFHHKKAKRINYKNFY